MKPLYLSLLCLLMLTACKSEKTETEIKEESKELTVAEKIANAHGYENWKNVEVIKFTFQVDRDTIKGKGRSWSWNPKMDQISMTTDENTVTYNRKEMDSSHIGADRAFINDKYWAFVPFQMVWDASATISQPKKAEAPISKTEMDMITITYPSEGGYTPGDAYDIFYNDDYMIKEWVFRKGNSPEPSMATTFENYKDYNGIKIATDHKMADGNWNLNFTDVDIIMK
ncbi:hypothetical protein [Winogradskyella ursingii]|uniref:hypothetical protein n=1 Tax=Winogradskyella ursingii TaxID=2686079 RepID=UPI0015C92F3D|nr:hypothetical protein [Winogradskyella ursingii]